MRKQLTMSSEPNSTSGGAELHPETYTSPSEQVNISKTSGYKDNLLNVDIYRKAEYLIHTH